MLTNDKQKDELRSNFKHFTAARTARVQTNAIEEAVEEIHKQSITDLLVNIEEEAGSTIDLPKSEIEAVKQFIRNSYDSIRTNKLTKKVELTLMGERKELNDRTVNGWLDHLWSHETYVFVDGRNGKESVKKVTIDDRKLYTLVNNDAFAPEYDPILEYFRGVELLATGTSTTPEIDKFISCFVCDNEKNVVDQYFKAWLAGIFTNYFTDVKPFDAILILKSNQGTGKTTAIEHYLLNPFRDYIVKSFSWNSTNKDEMIKLATSFVVFDDELSATKKSDIEELKKITPMRILNNIRPAYARTTENYIRRCSFIGATNNDNITSDSTGTRRFMILDVKEIDLEQIRDIDFNMLWSEAYNYFYVQGNKVDLRFETIEANNQKFKTVSAEEEYLERHFDFTQVGNTWYSSTEIYDLLKEQEPNLNTDVYKIGKALRSKGIEAKSKRTNGGSSAKRYHLHRIGAASSKPLTVSRGGQSNTNDSADSEIDDFFGINKLGNI